MAQKIAIQGYEGSFHQLAAKKFYGNDTAVVCCASFKELVRIAADRKSSDGGIMAIENSIAGSILPNYNLLLRSGLKITGEIYLPIRQHLLVNPGVQLSDIREVHSHPMAIQQCLAFLDKFNWKLVETEDTALSARHIHQHKNRHAAAIAGKLAAEMFGLELLAPNIQTQKHNYTRFLVLQRPENAVKIAGANKASVNFSTDHSKGSLARVLTKIAAAGINLSKLQSMPIPGSDFKYSFHVDMEFDEREQFNRTISAMESITEGLAVLGIYKNGKTEK